MMRISPNHKLITNLSFKSGRKKKHLKVHKEIIYI